MFSPKQAKELLLASGIFFDAEDLELPEGEERFVINMNDVWAWALADAEEVAESELPELARLFFRYGWCGVLYWVSQKNLGMRSEFYDNNRFIEFVEHEEELIKDIPDDSRRAYKKITYKLKGKRKG